MTKYPRLQDVVWLAEELQTKSMRQIAAELGSSYSAVQYMSVKHGIRVPVRRTYNITVDKSAISKKAYKKKYPNGAFGKLASNWRGGKQMFKGYIRIYMPDHPAASKNNPYIFEHRLVAEKELGRYLTKDEVVHHINGDKSDNRPENLKVVLRKDHVHDHHISGERMQGLHKRIKYLEQLLIDNHISYD